MPLFINKTEISDYEIINDMDQMRSHYIETFPDQNVQDREKILFDWASENIIERELLKVYAENNIHISDEDFTCSKKKKKVNGFEPEKIELKINKLIRQIEETVPLVTKDEARNYFKKNKDSFKIPERRHVKHIVKHQDKGSIITNNEVHNLLNNAEAELKSGIDFEEVGNKHSDCQGEGLDLGYFSRGKMVDAFENIVFSLKKGEISKIFESEVGFHIAKVYDILPPQSASFKQVCTQILKKLQDERTEKKIEDFIDQLKKKAGIEYVDPENLVKSAKSGFLFPKPVNFLLVKPSGPDCNMSCNYCFYLKKKEIFKTGKKRMDLNIAEQMIKQAAEQYSGNINIVWQGGEPLLMGLSFYRTVIKFQNKYAQNRFGNSIQTNGILINKEWADLFKKNTFLIGLSIDGAEHVHDKYRKDKGKKGTWKKVKKSANLLFENGVEVNSLSVVNDYSAEYVEETYNFLKKTGFKYMQFIPAVEFDPFSNKTSSFSVDPVAYGKFLSRLFDLWKGDFSDGKPNIYIRFFESIFSKYMGMEPPDCSLMEECGKYLVVEHNGNIYPCDFFVDPAWKLGNIKQDNLTELLNSKKQDQFGKLKKDLSKECIECKWKSICYGSCPKDWSPSGIKCSYFCEGYKIFFEHADQDFRKMTEFYIRKKE